MRSDGKLDYLEMPSTGMPETKTFYESAFGWSFVDYGPSYVAFDEGLQGGFDTDPSRPAAPLPVLYAADLEAMAERITAAGGRIVKPIFPFPGGRRLHFLDPSGNELAVWSETE